MYQRHYQSAWSLPAMKSSEGWLKSTQDKKKKKKKRKKKPFKDHMLLALAHSCLLKNLTLCRRAAWRLYIHRERTVSGFAYLCHRKLPNICKQLQGARLLGNTLMPVEIHTFSNGSRLCPPHHCPGKPCACVVPPADFTCPIRKARAWLLI